jgi:hypothetical protein
MLGIVNYVGVVCGVCCVQCVCMCEEGSGPQEVAEWLAGVSAGVRVKRCVWAQGWEIERYESKTWPKIFLQLA